MRVSVHLHGRFLRAVLMARDVVRIGRLASCDIVLDGEGVSRLHAFLERGPDSRWTLVSMGPTALRMNGLDVTRTKVRVGDELKIAGFRLVFMDDEVPDLVIVPADGELIAARVAPVLWAATAEEMQAEQPTGEESPIPLDILREPDEPIYLLTQRKRT